MGFSLGYSDVFLPKTLLRTLSLLASIRNLILVLFRFLGLSHFFEPDPDPVWQVQMPDYPPVLAVRIREILAVVKFHHLDLADPPDTCAVCLHVFESEDEIRCLRHCTHIFHRACLDRWMDQDQTTCPLCRTSFLPGQLNQRTTSEDDLYCQYSSVSEL